MIGTSALIAFCFEVGTRGKIKIESLTKSFSAPKIAAFMDRVKIGSHELEAFETLSRDLRPILALDDVSPKHKNPPFAKRMQLMQKKAMQNRSWRSTRSTMRLGSQDHLLKAIPNGSILCWTSRNEKSY